MARVKTTVPTILAAVMARVIAAGGFTTDTVYITLNPDDTPAPNAGAFFCAISPSSGLVGEGEWVGGGVEQVRVTAEIDVTVYLPQNLDSKGRDNSWLTHATLGALEKARVVTKSLVGHDLQSGGSEILCHPIEPLGYAITRLKGKRIGYITETFRVIFDRDLTS